MVPTVMYRDASPPGGLLFRKSGCDCRNRRTLPAAGSAGAWWRGRGSGDLRTMKYEPGGTDGTWTVMLLVLA